jgi:hypothetical protein
MTTCAAGWVGIAFISSACLLTGPGARAGDGLPPDESPMDELADLPQANRGVPPTPLTTEQEERVLAAVFSRFPNVDREDMMGYIHEHFPGELQEFTLVSMRDLGGAVEYLLGLVSTCLELQATQERDPSAYASMLRLHALEREADSLGRICREATERIDPEAREAASQRLGVALTEAFSIKQELMRSDVAEIEQELERLRALVDQRERNRAAIISQRMRELAGELDGVQW